MPRWIELGGKAVKGRHKEPPKMSADEARIEAAEHAELPDRPCFRCEARGWCEHRVAP